MPVNDAALATAGSSPKPETPFLDRYAAPEAAGGARGALRETPFLSEYPAAEGEEGDSTAELIDELLEGLHDEELDEAIGELTEELRGMVASGPLSESEHDDAREAMLREALAPLVRAAEAEVVRVAEALARTDLSVASEAELDEAIGAAPLPELGNPVFELFFSKWRKKILNVVKKGAALASKAGLGFIVKAMLGRLFKLVKPTLEKVLKFALDKVPAAYRPQAAALAARLGFGTPAAPSGGDPNAPPAAATAPDAATAPALAEPATPDTSQAQHELDLSLAEVALGGGRMDHEVIGSTGDSAPIVVLARDPYADLGRARTRFVREITEAGSPEEAEVIVERFLPAVLMAVRQGIRIIGRPRVVSAFGGLISKFIAPLIGPANAPALGKILADLGLRTFLQAEADPESAREAAGQAIAATVEETVRRVAQLPDELVEQPETMAAYAREAFEQAAAANFPASLVRPELRETEKAGAWILLPRRGRAVCRKFSHVFDVAVSPQVASILRGYGSSTVAGLFRDRLRLALDGPVKARLHIYEAVPGTTLAGIARMEEVHGLGSAEAGVWSQIQPLTPEAAALLAGSPRLGRELPDDAEPAVPRLGQRFYYLEVAGGPPRPLGKESSVRVGVDLRQGEVRLGLYLSEVVAQKIAAALRTKAAAPTVVAELRALLANATGALGTARAGRLVRILGAGRHRRARAQAGAAGRGARRAVRRQIGALALQWAWKHLAAQLPTDAADFIAKTEGPEDGVRLVFTFQVPAALAGVRKLFRGQGLQAAGWPPPAAPPTTLRIHAGPRHV